MRSWKYMVQEISFTPPACYEEWLSSYFWWDAATDAIGPMFSRLKAAELHNRGLRFVRDIWIEERTLICSAEEAKRRFGLLPTEFIHWARIAFPLTQAGQRFLLQRSTRPNGTDWVGLFLTRESKLPNIVF
jgi:hypothetical protein